MKTNVFLANVFQTKLINGSLILTIIPSILRIKRNVCFFSFPCAFKIFVYVLWPLIINESNTT